MFRRRDTISLLSAANSAQTRSQQPPAALPDARRRLAERPLLPRSEQPGLTRRDAFVLPGLTPGRPPSKQQRTTVLDPERPTPRNRRVSVAVCGARVDPASAPALGVTGTYASSRRHWPSRRMGQKPRGHAVRRRPGPSASVHVSRSSRPNVGNRLPTSCPRNRKGHDQQPHDHGPDLRFCVLRYVAGAGFEPATSGL
jgi:hypothetical protein